MSSGISIRDERIIHFLRMVARGVQKFGIKRVEQRFNDLYPEKRSAAALKKWILEETAGSYDVSVGSLLKSKKRGHITKAKVTAMLLIDKHTTLNRAEIAVIFDCDESLISRRIKSFTLMQSGKLNAVGSFDKIFDNDFYIIYRQLDAAIIKMKTA